MGFRCERCGHEWLPRIKRAATGPVTCPRCKSPYWNKPKTSGMPYEEFKTKIQRILVKVKKPLTWTEIRTKAKLHQLFPNNQWVRKMEKDVALKRFRDKNGIIHWQI